MNTRFNHYQSTDIKKLATAWLVWGIAAAFYFSDYMARVSVSVLHHDLQIVFNMNEAQFGILSASFYLPYILMQLPVGLIVDRISIRKILTAMSLLTACACCVFGLANHLVVAAAARMVIGFTAAFAFISTLRLATMWFPARMIGLLSGLTQAIGMFGAAAGQAPVAILVDGIGWRHSMLVIAGIFIILAIFLYRYVSDAPSEMKLSYQKTQTTMSIWWSLRIVLSKPQTWINALYTGFLFAPTAVIGESFGAAYIEYGRHIPGHAAAFIVSLIFIGWTIGGPISGWISDRVGRRKPMMILSALFGVVLSSWIVFAPQMTFTLAAVVFFIFGFTNVGVSIAYALSTEIHHRMVVGTAIAFTNMMSIFVGAALQPIVGRLIDNISQGRAYHIEHLSLTDFQYGLCILPLCALIALFLACMTKETFCTPLKNEL